MNKRAAIAAAEKEKQESERQAEEERAKKASKNLFSSKISDVLAEVKDPDGISKSKDKLPHIKRSNSRKRSSVKTPSRSARLASLKRTSTLSVQPMTMADVVPLAMQSRLNDMPPEAPPDEDPIFRGVIPPSDFHEFISKK